MTQETIDILDSALWYSFLAFLVLILLASCWIALSSYSRQQRRADSDEQPQPALQATAGDLGRSFKAVLLCAVLSALFLVGLLLTPFSFLDNFVNTESWKLKPLRLTHLTLQRLEAGFVLEGELYNQTEEAIPGLSGMVKIWGVDKQLLDEVAFEVEPSPLPPLESGRFKVRYDEEPVLLYGYEVVFLDAEGNIIPHTQGFDLPEPDQPQAPSAPTGQPQS